MTVADFVKNRIGRMAVRRDAARTRRRDARATLNTYEATNDPGLRESSGRCELGSQRFARLTRAGGLRYWLMSAAG